MVRRPTKHKRTATLVPYTTRFRSTKARRECGERHAGTLDRFRYEGERFVLGRLDNDVICLGIADLELVDRHRSEEHTSELQSLMRSSYAVLCLKKNQELHTNSHTIRYRSMQAPHHSSYVHIC